MSALSSDAELIEAVLEVLRRRAGLTFPSSRLDEAANVVCKTWRASGLTDPTQFIAQVETESTAFDALVNRLAVGESYFFREPAQFDLIRDRVLPDLRRRGDNAPPRIWSAGCAAGEEPYSLAILLEREGFGDQVTVLATDLSSANLRAAREARFRPWSLRSSTPEFVARYFDRVGEHVRLIDRIRRRVRFERHNLNGDATPELATGLDLILCRNVMIYFDSRAIERAARMFFGALNPEGWLITAPADPPLSDFAPFAVVMTPAGLVYRRAQPTTVSMPGTGSVWPAAKPFRRTASRQRSPGKPYKPARTPPAETVELDAGRAVRDAFAAGDFTRVLALTSESFDDAPIRSLRIRALANIGDIDRAVTETDEGVRRHALNAELHCLRALLAIGLGRDEDAITGLRRAIYLDRTLAMAHFTLGAVLRRRNEIEEASRAFGNALAICEASASDMLVPLADGETAGELAKAARSELERIAVTGAST